MMARLGVCRGCGGRGSDTLDAGEKMTTQYRVEERRSGAAGAVVGVLLAVVLGACALGFFVHSARTGLAGRLASLISGRTQTFLSAPDVVERVQRLNRLETVTYSLDTVVESKESNPVLPDVLAGDRLLMIVHGQTVAGIDFSKLKPDSVQMSGGPQGRAIRLVLPPSEVFVTTIDNARTRVYQRDTGLFVGPDPNLETATRAKAQGELQQAALTDGILDVATKNARETVRAMLEGLGFTKVDLE